MSKQRLQELEAQYNACIYQQQSAIDTDKSVVNEITKLKGELSAITNNNTNASKTLKGYSDNLANIQSSNNTTNSNITAERAVLNKLTSLLGQYNEYVPPTVNPINVNENSTNVEQAGEIAAFIERANN